MTLEEARRQIDALDLEIRDLLMRRMDMSRAVAESKRLSGDLTVYRPEREGEILRSLGEGVPEERRDAYLAVVRKILEGSRRYQYSLLYDRVPGIKEDLFKGLKIPENCLGVRLRLKCPDRPGVLTGFLSMAEDAGCVVQSVAMTGNGDPAIYEITVLYGQNRAETGKLMYQLFMESRDLEILEAFGPEEDGE